MCVVVTLHHLPHLPHLTYLTSPISPHLSHLTYLTSPTSPHLSHLTYLTSPPSRSLDWVCPVCGIANRDLLPKCEYHRLLYCCLSEALFPDHSQIFLLYFTVKSLYTYIYIYRQFSVFTISVGLAQGRLN